MLLYDLKEGQSGKLTALLFDTKLSERLRDMGFCEGETVSCVKRAAFKSPVLYRVKGSLVALRKSEALKIEVVL